MVCALLLWMQTCTCQCPEQHGLCLKSWQFSRAVLSAMIAAESIASACMLAGTGQKHMLHSSYLPDPHLKSYACRALLTGAALAGSEV